MKKKPRAGLRLVKCPKCAKILPEPEQVPVYACGGCNTVLKAKYYRSDKKVRGSGLQQEKGIQSNGVAYALSGAESDDSSQRSSSAGRQSLDQNEERDQGLVVNRNNMRMETANGANQSDESTDGKTDQTHSVVDCNQKHIAELDSSKETSMLTESQGLEKSKSELVDKINGKKEDQDYQLEQSDDIAFHKHKQLRKKDSYREASLLDESLGILDKEQFEVAPENKSASVAKDNVKEGDGYVECPSEKLEQVKLDEAPLPTEITQDGHEEITLEIGEIGSLSASSSARYTIITRDDVSQLPRCKSSPLDNVIKSRHGSRNLKSTDTVNGPRPPTKGSFVYEESISSFDGNDDQAPRTDEHGSVETLPGNNAVSAYVRVEENYEGEVNSSSLLLDEKLNRSTLEDEESLEESQLPSRRTVTNRHGLPPKIPPYWSSEVAYETGSSSSYAHDELLPSHPDRYKKPETCVRKTHTNRGHMGRRRRFLEQGWRENEFLTMYYGYETSGEIYQRAGFYDSCIDQRRRSESWSQREVFNGRYQMHNPNMHQHRCYLDDLRRSAQLPPSGVYSREMRWDPYESYLTNPRHLMEPEPEPWDRDMIILSDDRGYKDQIMRRLYLREKRQTVKRHLQPVAGGAPFITCYFCFRVLRLPEDFLSSRKRRKRTHMLKCGACSKILQLSLENEPSLPACTPNSIEEAQTDARDGSFVSEDAKVQDGDGRASLLSDSSFRGSEREKSITPASTDEEREEESDDGAREYSSVQGRQMKVTWQLPAWTKSPLHRLMGYSSLNDLLNGHDEDGEIV